tara:strand:+ start:1612 stop:2478 length:867 start_codon:yes stop_codon:yes gene_type:complete
MLPSLGALSLVHTSAKDDVLTEIMNEQRDALAYWSERRAAPVRKEVLDNNDLLEVVLLALDRGDESWEVCKIIAHWCSLNKAHKAECDDRFWNRMGERIWGKQVQTWWQGATPQKRFAYACKLEHEFRTGERKLNLPLRNLDYNNVKRIVLAAIAASPRINPVQLRDLNYTTLQYASTRLKDDEDVVRAAVAKDARAIRFASPRLQALVKMPPTVFWPPTAPTDFERQWGEEVRHMLLYGDWSNLTLKGIRVRLWARHPELDMNYFRITHREEFKDLVNRLMAHFFVP